MRLGGVVPGHRRPEQLPGLVQPEWGRLDPDRRADPVCTSGAAAKSWYIDRMVLLYEDMKARDPK